MVTRRTRSGRRQRPSDSPERWLILCRQSDTDDAGERSLSLESQERSLREAAASQGAIVVAAVRDADLKGYQDETQRPALAEALRQADAGAYDVLAVWELSRLARKLSLQERVLERLEQASVRLYSHREPWASATMVRQILGAVAEEQTRAISAHVARAMRERIRAGKWHGVTPYGYHQRDGVLTVDEERARWVRILYDRRLAGETVASLVRWLDAQGAPVPIRKRPDQTWNAIGVVRILRHPVYMGGQTVDGTVVLDVHPQIVTPARWRAVQAYDQRDRELRGARRRYGRYGAVDTFLKDGLAWCGCGSPLYPVDRTSGGRQPALRCQPARFAHPRGSCTQRPRNILVAVAERVVRERLAETLQHLRPWREAEREARRHLATLRPERDLERRAAQRDRDAALARQTRARDLFVAGRIDLDAYDLLVAPIEAQLAAADARLAEAAVPPLIEELPRIDREAQRAAKLVLETDIPGMRSLMVNLGVTMHLDPDAPDHVRLEFGEALRLLIGPLGSR